MKRLKSLQRIVAQQGLLRDRHQQRSGALRAAQDRLSEQERALLAHSAADGVLHAMMLANIAKRMTALAKEKVSLAAQIDDADRLALKHARLAKTGESVVDRLQVDADRQAERARLEEIAERLGQLQTSPWR